MPDFARQVLDALPFTVYTTDLAGQITSVNRSWSQFAGENGAPTLVNERNVCGLSLWSALGDTSYRRQVEGALEDLRTGRVPAVTWEFPCSSPSDERVFLMQITPLRDRDHHPTGFVFSTVNITPSHRSREALIETGLALARPIDLDRLFVEVGHQVRRALPALEFSVWLSAPDTPLRDWCMPFRRMATPLAPNAVSPALWPRHWRGMWRRVLSTGRAYRWPCPWCPRVAC